MPFRRPNDIGVQWKVARISLFVEDARKECSLQTHEKGFSCHIQDIAKKSKHGFRVSARNDNGFLVWPQKIPRSKLLWMTLLFYCLKSHLIQNEQS